MGGWDNLETRRKRQLATIMFKLKNQIAPDHLAQNLISTYSYNLRNSVDTYTCNLFYQDHILRLVKAASIIHVEGWFSGIVFQILLKSRQARNLLFHICNSRIVITINIYITSTVLLHDYYYYYYYYYYYNYYYYYWVIPCFVLVFEVFHLVPCLVWTQFVHNSTLSGDRQSHTCKS